MTTRSPLALFFLGSVLATLTSIGGWILAPIESVYLTSLTDNGFLIGLTYALGSILVAGLGLYLGRLSDGMGRKKILLIGLSIGIIFPIVYASSLNIFMYMGGKSLWAFTMVATGPVLGAYLQSLVQGMPRRGHYLSMLYGGMSLSGAFGHYAGGWLFEFVGDKAPFYALASIYLVSTLIAWLLLHEDPAQNKHLSESNSQPHDIFFGIRYIFSRVALKYYFILNSSFAVAYSIKLLLWPLIIFSFTTSSEVMGLIFAMTGVVAFLVFFFSGRVVDNFGVYTGINIAFVSLIVGGILMGFAPGVYTFIAGAFFFTIGEAFYGSAQGVLLIDHVENRYRGEVLGVDSVLDRGFGAVAMLMAGTFLLIISPQIVWMIFIVLMIVSYFVAIKYRSARKEKFDVVE
ncbi:MFS transporter [Candidatus Nomurabacteria bacterium]|nr:MFS transporter [Candidatus Kaiserbacteria bacterium]MCB9814067.1 MFS transporter [Candidatus Nomurabacteria bacterium]